MIGPTREEMIGYVLFGIPVEIARLDRYAYVAVGCSKIAPESWRSEFREWLDQSFRERMLRDEASFLDYFSKLLGAFPGRLQHLREIGRTASGRSAIRNRARAIGGTHLVALGVVETYAARFGAELGADEIERLAQKAERVFLLALEYDWQLKMRLIADGYELGAGKNLNDMWDWLILHSIVTDEMIDNVPVRLITSDRRLIDLATGPNNSAVASLESHCASLGL
jgi:hypothetical protein